jgi:hypothetical protein
MPIAINGSGTITGISVGGIPDGTVDTDVLAANAVTYAKIGTTEQGQLCKAWVNFNGTSTVAIRASYNVSSITDNGTGDYTVNFTTALADANYATVISCQEDIGVGAMNRYGSIDTVAAGNVRVLTGFNGTYFDPAGVFVAIFR